MKEKIILYFLKYPEPGRVKTRLAKALGNEEAARLYRELTEQNFMKLQDLPGQNTSVIITFDPPEAEINIRAWLSHNRENYFLPQEGATLGERLAGAFKKAFEAGAKKVLALGSDTLGLEAAILEQAYEALDRWNLVLGPAKDGGYYLIGLSNHEPSLFENIPWSTGNVLEATLTRAKELELSYGFVPELEDLDTIENIKQKG